MAIIQERMKVGSTGYLESRSAGWGDDKIESLNYI